MLLQFDNVDGAFFCEIFKMQQCELTTHPQNYDKETDKPE